MKIIIISPAFPPDRDGVGDYTSVLADGLAEKNEVIIVTSKSEGAISEGKNKFQIIRTVKNWGGFDLFHIVSIIRRFSPELIIIQYVSFMYGRGGINLVFPLLSILLRIRYRVFTMVHEPFTPFGHSIKTFLISLVQRLMLFFLIMGSDRIGVSIKVWERMLKRFFFWRKGDFRWIPVPSNIKIAAKTNSNEKLQRFNKNPLLTFFGSLHITKMVEFLTASLDALVKKGYDSGLLIIGQDEKAISDYLKELPDYLRERIFCTGYCSGEDVSQYLSSLDIFLLPLIDGVSSRRTTLMAALNHGVPVISTSGYLTDDIFLQEDFTLLSPSTDKELFVANVLKMAGDEKLKESIGKKGKEAYEQYFSKKLMIERYLEHSSNSPKIKWCWGLKISDQMIIDALSDARNKIKGILLDVGCGKKPYNHLLGYKTIKWIGIDRPITHSGLSSADIFGDGKYLPLKNESFDTILCTQVIEHVDEPDILFKEISRVLKKGGVLIMTVPQTNFLHEEPHDYYRFTKYGLTYLAGKHGLKIDKIDPLGGVFAMLGQTISAHTPLIRKPLFLGEILRSLLQGIINIVFFYLDKSILVPESTIGYILIGTKI